LASSLYTEKDEPIASVLTRTLLETGQEVPDFLQQYIPEGADLKFEADSDYEPDQQQGGFGDASAWGNDDGNDGGNDGGAWGSADGGWGENPEANAGDATAGNAQQWN